MSQIFEDLFDHFINNFDDVEAGVMMREPAVMYKSKVFMFYYAEKESMCFKLGKGFLIEEYVDTFQFLSPFINKPPMYAWYIVGKDDQHAWEELATIALEQMQI